MRAYLIPFLLLLEAFGAHPAFAQAAPFDMTPGGNTAVTPDVRLPVARSPAAIAPATPAPFEMQPPPLMPTPDTTARPTPARPFAQPSARPAEQPAATAAPFDMTPAAPRSPSTTGRAQPPQAPGRTGAPTLPASGSVVAARGNARNEKPLLPFDDIRLEGESDARSWAFSLTQEEAANALALAVGYQNAVVVMPEASRLRVIINGEAINDITIASSANIFRSVVPIRSGLLRAGQNIIRIEAVQRHRTDCTIRATYELWTQLDSASTGLIFADNAPPRPIRSLEDLPAVGMDTQGITTIRIVAARIYRPEIRDRLLRLAQMVALRGRYAHPVIRVVESDSGPSPAGTIKVVMGVASELRAVMAAPPEAANAQALAIVMHDASSGSATLVVSGPTWNDLDNAINIVGAPALNRDGRVRNTIDTASWMWPEVPTLPGGRPITLLGSRCSHAGIRRTALAGAFRRQSAGRFLCERLRRGDLVSRRRAYACGSAGEPDRSLCERPDQRHDDDHRTRRRVSPSSDSHPDAEFQIRHQSCGVRDDPADGRR